MRRACSLVCRVGYRPQYTGTVRWFADSNSLSEFPPFSCRTSHIYMQECGERIADLCNFRHLMQLPGPKGCMDLVFVP
jgi:hypothetical protein